MFDLNTEVTRWRNQFAEPETMTTADLDELESHLRDSFGALQVQLDEPEEAFWLATRRLGSPSDVSQEFAKINPAKTWMRRAQWMFAGYLLVSVLLSAVGVFQSGMAHLVVFLGIPLWPAFVLTSTGTAVGAAFLIAWTWRTTEGRSSGLQVVTDRCSGLVRSGRQGWLFAAILLTVAIPLVCQMFLNVVATRILSVAQYSSSRVIYTMTSTPGKLLLLGVLVGSLCYLHNQAGGPGEVVSNGKKLLLMLLLLMIVIPVGFGFLSLGVTPLFGPHFAY